MVVADYEFDPDLDPDAGEADAIDPATDANGDPDPGDDCLPADLLLPTGGPIETVHGMGTTMPSSPLAWLGAVKASTRAVAVEVCGAAASAGLALELVWGLSASGEHRLGYSADYMTWNRAGAGHDAAIGEFVARYVWAHRWHLGVRYLIWNRQIRNREVLAGAWRPYSGVSDHTDHVHVCRYPRVYDPHWTDRLPELSRKALNAALGARRPLSMASVRHLQHALNIGCQPSPLLVIDGDAGQLTRNAVVEWQRQIRSAPISRTMTVTDLGALAGAAGSFMARP